MIRAAAVGQRQQLHQVIVHGRPGRLDQQRLAIPHGLVEANLDFAVGRFKGYLGAANGLDR